MKLFLFIFLSFSICSLNAELKFQQKTLNFTLDNENQFVDFEFKFKNDGKSPLLITNILWLHNFEYLSADYRFRRIWNNTRERTFGTI